VPTKRRKLSIRRIGITAAALEAWRLGDFHALNREVGIGPWQWSPFDVTREEPPGWVRDRSRGDACGCNLESYVRAWELRQALIEAAGRPGRVGRHGEPLGLAEAHG
jgi:hypothetical protein